MTGEFPTQRTNNVEKISIWWRHHGTMKILVDYPSTQRILHIPNNLVRLLWFRIGPIFPSTYRAIWITFSLWNELYQYSESKDPSCGIKKIEHFVVSSDLLTSYFSSTQKPYSQLYLNIYIYTHIYRETFLSIHCSHNVGRWCPGDYLGPKEQLSQW